MVLVITIIMILILLIFGNGDDYVDIDDGDNVMALSHCCV